MAGGHLTETPAESVYSGVVSLRSVRLVVFLAELNNLKVWQTGIGNTYVEALTKEKAVYCGDLTIASENPKAITDALINT